VTQSELHTAPIACASLNAIMWLTILSTNWSSAAQGKVGREIPARTVPCSAVQINEASRNGSPSGGAAGGSAGNAARRDEVFE